jgi:predicted nucleotidyltransferase component of viral defense system
MTNDLAAPPPHANERDFAEAVNHTAASTGFNARLIEKDYHCSLVLRSLVPLFEQGLVFKGGTCLSKVHTRFLRLSEDLDFGISIVSKAKPKLRREAAKPFKEWFEKISGQLSHLQVETPLSGHHGSRHYSGCLTYSPVVTRDKERLKLELSLTEELLTQPVNVPARSLLSNPSTGNAVIPEFHVRAISMLEAYAEKVRAALTRRKPAIRDFFDIGMAIQGNLLDHRAEDFLKLVAPKLKVDTKASVDLSEEKCAELRRQREAQLKPVLREADYNAFDFERAVQALKEIVKSLPHAAGR